MVSNSVRKRPFASKSETLSLGRTQTQKYASKLSQNVLKRKNIPLKNAKYCERSVMQFGVVGQIHCTTAGRVFYAEDPKRLECGAVLHYQYKILNRSISLAQAKTGCGSSPPSAHASNSSKHSTHSEVMSTGWSVAGSWVCDIWTCGTDQPTSCHLSGGLTREERVYSCRSSLVHPPRYLCPTTICFPPRFALSSSIPVGETIALRQDIA